MAAIRVPEQTMLLVCDIQERYRKDMFEFDAMSSMIGKLVKAAKIMNLATLTTEQSPKALGTVEEVGQHIRELEQNNLGIFRKSKFSMHNKDTTETNDFSKFDSFIVTGVESHVCVLQTALDLLRMDPQPTVFIPADCVSSGNKQEIPIAFRRMERAGAIITTSESVLFELLGGADHPKFDELVELIQEDASATAHALEKLL
ncbi:hypothetical protein IAR50_004780 [Cryptococcus sp. DSM 104548]